MFYILGIGVNLFLILLLVSKKNKMLADKFLLAWLTIICFHLFFFLFANSTKATQYIEGFVFGPSLPLLHGPMLYLYTASITNQLTSNKKLWIAHFLPSLFAFIMLSSFFWLTKEDKMLVYLNRGQGYEIELLIIKYAIILSGITYIIWIFYLLEMHKKNIVNNFSYEENINLKWLKYLIYGLGTVWLIVIAQAVNKKSYNDYIFGVVVLIIVMIGYFGIKQGRIFSLTITHLNSNENNLAENYESTILFQHEVDENVFLKKKYLKSGLSEAASYDLYQRLQILIQTEKTFKEPELSLTALSDKLNTNPNYLSQVINEKEQKTFYDYINYLRVTEFINQIQNPDNDKFTILSIAFDCGFNSKSSFNKNFKKVTGQTPSDFLKTSIGSL